MWRKNGKDACRQEIDNDEEEDDEDDEDDDGNTSANGTVTKNDYLLVAQTKKKRLQINDKSFSDHSQPFKQLRGDF
jgi:hypothetical protein